MTRVIPRVTGDGWIVCCGETRDVRGGARGLPSW